MDNDDLQTQVRSLHLEPGDIVVIECDGAISEDALARMRTAILPKLEGHELLIIGGGAHLGVLRLADVDHD